MDDSSSDESENDDAVEYTCETCSSQFLSSEKGCSLFKHLCCKCHAQSKAEAEEMFLDYLSDEPDRSSSENETTRNIAATVESSDGEIPASEEKKTDNTNAAAASGADNAEDVDGDVQVLPEPRNAQGVPWSICSQFYSKRGVTPPTRLDLNIGGVVQSFGRTKFDTGKRSSCVRHYVDINLKDRIQPLYGYNLLSAYYNNSEKKLVFSRCIATKVATGAKIVVLAVLRTKCPAPVYDILVMDVVYETIERINMPKFKKEYIYNVHESIEDDYTIQKLENWLSDNGHIYDPSRGYNKDDNGYPILEDSIPGDSILKTQGFGSSYFGHNLQRKSTRTLAKVLDEANTVDSEDQQKPPNKKQKTGKKGTKATKSNSTRKKTTDTIDPPTPPVLSPPPLSPCLPLPVPSLRHFSTTSAVDLTSYVADKKEDKDDEELISLQRIVNGEREKKKARLRKELDDLMAEKEEAEKSCHQSKPQQPLPVPVVDNPHSTVASASSTNDSSFMELQLFQNQTLRLSRLHDAEMQTAMMETFLLKNMRK